MSIPIAGGELATSPATKAEFFAPPDIPPHATGHLFAPGGLRHNPDRSRTRERQLPRTLPRLDRSAPMTIQPSAIAASLNSFMASTLA
jgi:hypothetical protein